MPIRPRGRTGHRAGKNYLGLARQRRYNAAQIQRKGNKYRNVGLRTQTQGTSTRTNRYT